MEYSGILSLSVCLRVCVPHFETVAIVYHGQRCGSLMDKAKEENKNKTQIKLLLRMNNEAKEEKNNDENL